MECNIFWEQVRLEEYSICSIYSIPESGIAERAGTAEIVVIDLNELWTFIPERMISVPFELE